MHSRRDFLKNAAFLAGGSGLLNTLPPSIQRALSINPMPGTTYLDAEHVVILMQENRSFDHSFGTLRGVRGFSDPRAIHLPNQDLVWLQTNASGQTFAPFRLNIKETQATWMGSLPHGWDNQVDARNGGKYDQWLIAKQTDEWGQMPLTMGYYNREDLPFYYALADAFTICDQNFCSSLTGTTPNRLYLWSGTAGGDKIPNSYANPANKSNKDRLLPDINQHNEATWTSFPERLEENNISWRIYQNELSIATGLSEEEDSWLGNFTDNPLEWFSRYHIRHYEGYQSYLKDLLNVLPGEIDSLEKMIGKGLSSEEEADKIKHDLKEKRSQLETVKSDLARWTPENFARLSAKEQNLHRNAFATNKNDPEFRQLSETKYRDGDKEYKEKVPRGDLFYQFRKDVENGTLPTVSWLVAPENFSDHPGSPWYGAWYVSEAMDILTKNPAVWKKTIFILCYDENDGYFDHVPPFVAPHPYLAHAGKVSGGIDPEIEFVTAGRQSPIGPGFRVPLIIASPWSRGGKVCSQLFDHTSIIRFLENFLSHKTGKPLTEDNISAWRRAMCGDLDAVFSPYNGETIPVPAFIEREAFMEGIHNAQYRKLPDGFKALSDGEKKIFNDHPKGSPFLPRQEKGIRPACALPYELYADGGLDASKKAFTIRFKAGTGVFGKKSAGAPFVVYAPGQYRNETCRVWNYAVAKGDTLTDDWLLDNFENSQYHLRVYGPNGFFREYAGNEEDPGIQVGFIQESDDKITPAGNILLQLTNTDRKKKHILRITDLAYQAKPLFIKLAIDGMKGSTLQQLIDLQSSHGWYDFSITVDDHPAFLKRFAGHLETGRESISDPFMGGVVENTKG